MGEIFFFFKYEIWVKYGQWCYHFKFLEEIRLHWLFHVGFGEIRFFKWHDVINSNSGLLANIKEFSGLALFKLIFFFLKLNSILTKNWCFMCQILTPEAACPPTCINLMETVRIFNMWVTPKTNRASFWLILKLFMHWMVCLVCYLGCIVVNINAFWWMKDHRTWLLSGIVAWDSF